MTNEQKAGAPPPKTAQDYERRAWLHYTQKELDQAEAGFLKALELNTSLIDSTYGLGITLKAAGEYDRAREAFEKVITLLDEGIVKDETRAKILHALTVAQITFLTKTAAKAA